VSGTQHAAEADSSRAGGILLAVIAITALVAAVVMLLVRMRYGADIGDESYYAAMPYSFVLGHRPFIDEREVYLLPGLLTWPLVKAYVSLVGGSTGIVLFVRRMWLVFVLAIGAVSFSTLRKLIRWELALLVALLPVVLVPFNIMSLSYNTMGSQFIVLGVALGARTVAIDDRRWWWLALAGLAHGLAAVAYPTLVIAIAFFSIAIVAVFRRGSLRPLLTYWAGAAVVALGLLGVFAYYGFRNVIGMVTYMGMLSRYLGGGAKLLRIAQQFAAAARPYRILAALLVAGGVAVAVPRVGDKARWFLPLCLPLLARGFIITPSARNLILTVLFGLFAGLFYLSLRVDEQYRRWLYWAGFAPVGAGLITTYTSANGLMNFGVGMAAALLGAGLLFALATSKGSELRALWAAVGILYLLGTAVYYQWNGNAVVHDVPIAQETVYLTTGPYAGLHTSPHRAQAVLDFAKDMKRYGRPGDRLFSYTGQCYGYLFSDFRPATDNIWFAPVEDELPAIQQSLLDHWKETGYPTLVFRKNDPQGYAKNDRVTQWVEQNCTLVATQRHWTIWRRK
jgi:hypothetical protein